MKKYFFLLCFVVLASCNKRGKLDSIGGPSWIFDPYAVSKNKDELAAVGISESTNGGLKMQIAQAENDAIGNLANQIQTKVDKVVEDSVNQNVDINAVAAKNKDVVNKNENVQKKFSAVTKSIVEKLPLSGARRTDIWQDPKSGNLYVRMIIEQEKVKSYFAKSVTMYQDLGVAGVDKATVKKITDGILGAGFVPSEAPTSNEVKE